ncbi:NAD(P)H-binding protein [Fragilaria crotonensis]|nr:NAD(P)H-binding protein [Fragilaria crotonensis]
MTSSGNTLVLVGGTGGLGLEVAKGLVTADGFDKAVALVRPSSADDKIEKLRDLGWVVDKVDFDDANALSSALSGAKVVVSTLSGAEMASLETKIIDAAKSSGVSLFVPSQFGIDYRRWNGDFPFFQGKRAVLAHAEEVGLPTLSVFVGCFSDVIFYFLYDIAKMEATLVGGGTSKSSFTKRSDIGFVLAKALADPNYASGGFLSMQGDCMPWVDALTLFEKVSGKKFTYTEIDGQESLAQEKALMEKGDLASFYQAFALHLLGDPARGSEGLDVSGEAVTLGVALEPLEETLKAHFGTDP